jgi:hypothetical protein
MEHVAEPGRDDAESGWTEAESGPTETPSGWTEAVGQDADASAAEDRAAEDRAAEDWTAENRAAADRGAAETPAEQTTGEPRVDAALKLLERLPGLPVSDHPELFEHVHARLSEVLDELESGSGAAGPAGR